MYRRFRAFTLAEILITIGIIGVVAALTIPVLMQNSNSKKFVTQFKKSLSTLNQAAIGAQAQYDMDYSNLTELNEDPACKNDTISSGKYSLCGLFNNTLSAQTYLGKYGNVKGINDVTPYSATVSSFNINDFLFFSFSDGAFVGFNPNAKECGVGVGNVVTTEMIKNGKLSNCLGFIDVNGPNPPNREVSCSDGDTELSVNTTCKVTNGSMGDIFPVVFHDGMVEPATNASLAAFLGGNGKEKMEDPKSDFDGVYTDENGNKIGLKMVTNDDGTYNNMTWEDAVKACPQGTKLPDINTLHKIAWDNLSLGDKYEYDPNNNRFENNYRDKTKENCGVGALGIQTLGPGCSGTVYMWALDETSNKNGAYIVDMTWAKKPTTMPKTRNISILCIEDK